MRLAVSSWEKPKAGRRRSGLLNFLADTLAGTPCASRTTTLVLCRAGAERLLQDTRQRLVADGHPVGIGFLAAFGGGVDALARLGYLVRDSKRAAARTS